MFVCFHGLLDFRNMKGVTGAIVGGLEPGKPLWYGRRHLAAGRSVPIIGYHRFCKLAPFARILYYLRLCPLSSFN